MKKQQVFKKAKAAVEMDKEVRKEDVALTEKPADENHDKENGSIDSLPTRTTTLPVLSPRRTSLQPIIDIQEGSPATLPSLSVPSETKSTEIPSEISVEEDKTAPSEKEIDISDDKPVKSGNKSTGDILVTEWTDSDESMQVDTAEIPKPREIRFDPSLPSTENLKDTVPSSTTEPTPDSTKEDTEEHASKETASQVTTDTEEQPRVTEEANADNAVPVTTEPK